MSTKTTLSCAMPNANHEENRTAPGTKGQFLVGSMFQFRDRPLSFLTDLARQYGDVVSYRVGHRRIMLFVNPEDIREILAFRHSDFTKWGTMKFLRAFLGDGLLTSEGDLHSRQRHMCQPLFHRPELASYTDTIVRHGVELVNSWKEGERIDTAKEMRYRTILILTDLIFGGAIREDAAKLGEALTEMMYLYPRYRRWLPVKPTFRFRAARKTLYRVVQKITNEHLRYQCPNKFLSIFETAQAHGAPLDSALIRDEMVTFLFAGHETTTHALTWAWHLLAQSPDMEHKLHEELDSVLGGRTPTWEDVPKLVFTRGVFLESLRLYPPVWIMGRRAKRDLSIGGYNVPKKTIVVLSPFVTQRDERWYPDPLRFDPGRWQVDLEARRPKFAFIAFSAGPRQCIGEPLARLEGTLLLALIAQRWKLKPVSETTIDPYPTATLRPARPVIMQLLSR